MAGQYHGQPRTAVNEGRPAVTGRGIASAWGGFIVSQFYLSQFYLRKMRPCASFRCSMVFWPFAGLGDASMRPGTILSVACLSSALKVGLRTRAFNQYSRGKCQAIDGRD